MGKRRRDERREGKKTMERQKKQDMKRKMSLGGGAVKDEPTLFKLTGKSLQALKDQDKYIDPTTLDSGNEDSDGIKDYAPSDSDSDDDNRLTRLEVDMAVFHELRKEGLTDKYRNKRQRVDKIKKETKKKAVMREWMGELSTFAGGLQD